MNLKCATSQSVFALSLAFALFAAMLCARAGDADDFFEAAREGNAKKLAKMLDANPGLIVSQYNRGWTALHDAAGAGHLAAVKLLLDRKADVNARTDLGLITPLHMAAGYGKDEIVKLLLTHDADVNAAAHDGTTPLHMAAAQGHWRVVKLLLAVNAKVDARAAAGRTPLHRAAALGRLEVVKLLVAAKAEVNALDENRKTPLDLAINNGSEAVVEFLKKNGAIESEPPDAPKNKPPK
jgi:ankyrin repeat protein